MSWWWSGARRDEVETQTLGESSAPLSGSEPHRVNLHRLGFLALARMKWDSGGVVVVAGGGARVVGLWFRTLARMRLRLEAWNDRAVETDPVGSSRW